MYILSVSEGYFYTRLFRGPCAVVVRVELVKRLPVYRYSVDFNSYSGPLGILGSDGKQSTA